MKYMLLIYSDPDVWTALAAAERDRMTTEAEQLMSELRDSGEWVGGEPLADPANTRTVRVRADVPEITDGPFLEAKEHLAGYCVVECDSVDRATQIAARWPDARHVAMEVRPIMYPAGMEM